MNISEQQHDQVTILGLEGRLDSNTSGSFEESVMSKIDSGVNRLVLDFSELDYISSAGLRVLLMAAKRVQAEKGAMALFGMKEHVKDVFEVSGFLPVLTVVDSAEAAIEVASA